ncbi:ubiquinone-dependent pyruvate dehydrogenase [Brevibacterium jeotgali]|uniref:Pyruvate dehydrogenase (Quinone) n=1 Tax=Brevibacterium jeotgali TaxID=1262550 RepID=A0A2H1L4Q9_9MICO|nr:ubiquinone-dependent pyruvate dehydrogenase [Brevibacterium jeotgali]TWB98649.1 pyruvate dehydrogenase (quinone) [Brevibacterium jeotgali]SMY11750.1 pyruvate dehydrogenase (quinone) [Brevibacterium jeotgali]
MPTAAQHIVDTLAASGVSRVYGIAGDSLNGFTDALRGTDGISWFSTRHEEAAAFAASAEAGLTGALAACAGSCGPGNTHLVNGLYDAMRSRVPVLAIAAQIPSEEIGTGYFQETHPQELFRESSVYIEHVSSAEQLPRLLRIALREALSQRGPAVLVIPGDVLLTRIDTAAEAVLPTASATVPAGPALAGAAQALNDCTKVTILAGAGVDGARDQVIELAERLQAPIVHALRGKEFIEHDNPYDVGMSGLLGFASGYHAMMQAETLVMLGTDFPYPQFLPQDATVIQVDIRGGQIGRRTRVDHPLVGDVRSTVAALLPMLTQQEDAKHLARMVKHYGRTRKELDDLATPARRRIHPQYLTRLLDEGATDDAVFLPDVGSPVMWAARHLTMNGKRRLIGSFSHGSMANALSQAIGAQSAYPDRQVIAMAGDGGLSMLMGELLTVHQYDLPVKTVVYNNDSLNFVELEMKAAGFVTHATDLGSTDFAAIADAVGIKGFRVEKPQELEETVKAFLAHDGPALLDVVVERQELSMPPSIKAQQAAGFALFAVRTVLSGRGDELIDLAKANLRQLL